MPITQGTISHHGQSTRQNRKGELFRPAVLATAYTELISHDEEFDEPISEDTITARPAA